MEQNNEKDNNRLHQNNVPEKNSPIPESNLTKENNVNTNIKNEESSNDKSSDNEEVKAQPKRRNNRGRYYRNRNWKNKKKQSEQSSEKETQDKISLKKEDNSPEIKESSDKLENKPPKLIEEKSAAKPPAEKPERETKSRTANRQPKQKTENRSEKNTRQVKQKENVPSPKPIEKSSKEKTAAQKKPPTHIPPKKNNRNKPAVKKPVKKAVPLSKRDNRSFPGIKSVSIVIPLLNEEESLRILYNDIKKAISPYSFDYEIIFIDDGSTDNSLNILRDLSRRDNKVHYFSFRKNYGKSAALNVGFKRAKGDAVITMDADLQDDPAEIPNLLRKLSEGYDLVSGWKKVRHDPFIKRHSSKFFNYMTRLSSDVKIHDFNCGLKAYRKEVIKIVYVHGELHRYIPVLAGQKGFKITEIPVKHHPRRYGKTKFGISRFFKGFVDLLTILMITRYATRPLHLFGFIGTISFVGGFVIDGYLTLEWLLHKTSLSNRPLLLLGLLMMIVGVQLFAIGLLGELFVHKFRTDLDFSIKESK